MADEASDIERPENPNAPLGRLLNEAVASLSGAMRRGQDALDSFSFAMRNPTYTLLSFGTNLAKAAAGLAGNTVKSAAGLPGEAIGMLVSKFSAIAGPLAIFGQILQSNASGFQVLSGAVKVLAGTLAPLLLPVVAIVAAGLVMLSDKLWEEIAPALEDFYGQVMDDLVPAVEWLVDAFVDVVKWVRENIPGAGGPGHENEDNATLGFGGAGAIAGFALGGPLGALLGGWAGGKIGGEVGSWFDDDEPTGGVTELISGLTGALKFPPGGTSAGAGGDYGGGYSTGDGGDFGGGKVGGDYGPPGDGGVMDDWLRFHRKPETGGGDYGAGGDFDAAPAPAAPAAPAAGGGRGSSAFSSAMGDVMKELRLSMGPKASIGSLSDVGNSFQLAALNQSPFEAKMLERMDKALSALERVASGVERRPRASFGGSTGVGDYSGGYSTGGGGDFGGGG